MVSSSTRKVNRVRGAFRPGDKGMPALMEGGHTCCTNCCVASPSGQNKREDIIPTPFPPPPAAGTLSSPPGAHSDALNSCHHPGINFGHWGTESMARGQPPCWVGSLQSPVPWAESGISSAFSFFPRVAVFPPACPYLLHTVTCEDPKRITRTNFPLSCSPVPSSSLEGCLGQWSWPSPAYS